MRGDDLQADHPAVRTLILTLALALYGQHWAALDTSCKAAT